jgi:hypothetical protein
VQLSGEFTARHRLAPGVRRVPAGPQRVEGPPVKRLTVVWQPPGQAHSVRTQFATMAAHLPVPAESTAIPMRSHAPKRSLLVEWRLGGPTPRAYWLTNIGDRPVGELATLVKLAPHARYDLDELASTVGLGHHEGRSFGGWHHHVTLVSVAQAFLVLDAVCEPGGSTIPDHIRNSQFCW